MAFENSTILPSPLSAHAGRYLLETQTASNDASIDFTGSIDSTYDIYELEFYGVKMATDQTISIRLSTDDGSTWVSSAASYRNSYQYVTSAAGGVHVDDTVGYLGQTDDASSVHRNHGCFRFCDMLEASINTIAYGQSGGVHSSTYTQTHNGTITRLAAEANNAIQILGHSGGNISAGTFKLYGIK